MVTIEVPVAWAENAAGSYAGETNHPVASSCREALAARKTKYERWRERIKPYGEEFQVGWLTRHSNREQATLMSAAPRLLEALVDEWKLAIRDKRLNVYESEVAIMAALPKDVANEVLGK